MKTIIGAIVVALTGMLLMPKVTSPLTRKRVAPALATCFCQASTDLLEGKTSPSGVFLDLTDQVNTSYGGIFQQQEANQVDCKNLCQTAAESIGEWGIRSAACAAGVATKPPDWLTHIGVYSRVGIRPFRVAKNIGDFLYKPELKKTVCTCPSGWFNNANVNGGVTEGGCKRLAAKPINITPLPANGTPVGTWGFTWGNEVWAFGTAANGGSPVCVEEVTQQKECF